MNIHLPAITRVLTHCHIFSTLPRPGLFLTPSARPQPGRKSPFGGPGGDRPSVALAAAALVARKPAAAAAGCWDGRNKGGCLMKIEDLPNLVK